MLRVASSPPVPPSGRPLCSAAAGLFIGYDLGSFGGVATMKPFQAKFFPGVLDAQEDTSDSNYCGEERARPHMQKAC